MGQHRRGEPTQPQAAPAGGAGGGAHSTIRPSQSQAPLGRLPEVGELVDGKFKITQVLGQGGMGAVFSAQNTLTSREVALKWLLPEMANSGEASQRFLQEARAIGAVRHPNIIDIFDIGTADGALYLVMERLHGIPLDERITQGTMTPQGAASIMVQALDGLAAAHAKGIVHRDLKPANIFLCSGPGGKVQAKVLDFGISKITAPDGETIARLTAAGSVMGTPAYMSIEQIKDSHAVDGRTDVYACGVMLFEMVTGMLPFKADNFSAMVMKIAGEPPLDILEVAPGLDPAFAAVVTRAMARDAEDRYASVAELRIALSAFSGESHAPTPPAPNIDPAALASTAVEGSGQFEAPKPHPLPRMTPTAPAGLADATAPPSVMDSPPRQEDSVWDMQPAEPAGASDDEPVTVPGTGGSRTPMILVALVVLGGAAGWWLLQGDGGEPEAPSLAPAPAPQAEAPPAAEAEDPDTAAPSPEPSEQAGAPAAPSPSSPATTDQPEDPADARRTAASEARREARHERRRRERETAEAAQPAPVKHEPPPPPAPRLKVERVTEQDAPEPPAPPPPPPVKYDDGILRRSGTLDIDQF